MPEFHLDLGSERAGRKYQKLDAFTRNYILAAFFTETGALEDGNLHHATFADLAPETLREMIADCKAFQRAQKENIAKGRDKPDDDVWSQAGRDFWYTRNGHGCGFWDGDWPEPQATALADAATAFGETDMYLGSDEKIHVCKA